MVQVHEGLLKEYRLLVDYTNLDNDWLRLNAPGGPCQASYIMGFSSGAAQAIMSKMDGCKCVLRLYLSSEAGHAALALVPWSLLSWTCCAS
jgi:hypothetical protein